jgi:hypothetical protein
MFGFKKFFLVCICGRPSKPSKHRGLVFNILEIFLTYHALAVSGYHETGRAFFLAQNRLVLNHGTEVNDSRFKVLEVDLVIKNKLKLISESNLSYFRRF